MSTDKNTVGGYYQIGLYGGDNFKVNSTDTSAENYTTLDITIVNATISGYGGSVVVGQGINCSANVSPSDLNPTYSWSVDSIAIKGWYTDAAHFSQVLHLQSNDLNKDHVHFYWVDGGSKSVSCTVTVSGLTVSPDPVTFTVLRPTGANIIGYPRQPMYSGTTNLILVGGIIWQFVCPANPDPNGSWQMVQIVTSTNRVEKEMNGDSWTLHPPTSPILDSTYPYSSESNGQPDSDAPQEPLNPFITAPFPINPPNSQSPDPNGVVSAQMVDSFEDTLMFQPSGGDSIFVPIGTYTWSLQAFANRQKDAQGNYTTGWNPVVGSTTGGSYSDSTKYPEWNSNILSSYWSK